MRKFCLLSILFLVVVITITAGVNIYQSEATTDSSLFENVANDCCKGNEKVKANYHELVDQVATMLSE